MRGAPTAGSSLAEPGGEESSSQVPSQRSAPHFRKKPSFFLESVVRVIISGYRKTASVVID